MQREQQLLQKKKSEEMAKELEKKAFEEMEHVRQKTIKTIQLGEMEKKKENYDARQLLEKQIAERVQAKEMAYLEFLSEKQQVDAIMDKIRMEDEQYVLLQLMH